MNILIF